MKFCYFEQLPFESFQNLPHVRLDPFPAFFLQIVRYSVKGFGHAAGDAGQGVAVPAQGHCGSDDVLEAGALQECGDGDRYRALAADVEMISEPDFITGPVQRIVIESIT